MAVGIVKPVNIEQEMKSSYLDYAMSVIVSRALPDVRDGLKPVQRRILYAMNELGLRHNTPYKKSARIVGEVLGKYHPHGDAPVYEAMVRMAQDFSLRYVLVDGQGNFGSVDNDPPAAMRYTEARLAEIAQEVLADIDKNTVDFTPNFDNSLEEPSILPARLPNLVINGSSGIAVGIATNIPPHNLSEICDAVAYLIDSPDATGEELLEFVKGPDFPTGGIILGVEGIKSAYATGQGKVVVRAKVSEETTKRGGKQIIITELPYQINKASLVEKIAELVKQRKIEGISEVRDESDRKGMRVVIEAKKEAFPQQVINNLYMHTAMQTAFFINMVALVNGQPKLVNLKETLSCYIDFRREVVTRRSRFELKKARERAHILEGIKIALDNLERIIVVIRQSETIEAARNNLMAQFTLSPVQAQAILDMPLRRLAHLEQQKIDEEYGGIISNISYLEDLLANPKKVSFLIQQEVADLKSRYGDRRRTRISKEEAVEFRKEELIPHQKVMVILTHQGFIKRVPISTYRLQHRGGKGVMGTATREADSIRHILIANTHDNLLFFTASGKVHSLKCYEIPEDLSRSTKGTALVSLLPVNLEDKITTILASADFPADRFLVMATRKGMIKKTPLEKFAKVRRNGIMAMKLRGGDELISTGIAADADELILASEDGRVVKFKVDTLRSASRVSGGVHGIRPADGCAVGMGIVFPDACLLTVTRRGFGKLTEMPRYSTHRRGGKGIRAHRINEQTGKLAACQLILPRGYLIILSNKGNMVRIPIEQISKQSRGTKGVHLMSLDSGDSVVSITTLDRLGT
jgi:DNA gyrase subunit A